MADYATVLDACLVNAGLPTREETLSRTVWNSFRHFINHRIFEYWTRADLPYNKVKATLHVQHDILPFPQADISDKPDILRVLDVRDASGCPVEYQLKEDHLLFGDGGDDAEEFSVSVTYIRQPPQFPNKIWSAGLGVLPGDVLYWLDDGNFYRAHSASTADEFNPGPSGPFIKMEIPAALVNVLAFAVAGDYHLRNNDSKMALVNSAKAERLFSQVVQQFTTTAGRRRTISLRYSR